MRGNVVDGHDARDIEAEERFDVLHADPSCGEAVNSGRVST